MSSREPDTSGRVDPQLASLADHSLRWDQRHRLLAHVQVDPALLDELAVQRRAVELISGARGDAAPSDLHHHVALLVDQANRRRPTVRRALLRVGPVVACLTSAILAITLTSGGGAVFTLGDAIALTKAPVQLPVSLQSVEQGAASRSGWRPEGISVDRISGRIVTTVFYASREGSTIRYAVVGGPPLNVRGTILSRDDGIVYRRVSMTDRNVTAWVQGGHTHLLSGNVDPSTLLGFATLKSK